MSDLKPKVKWLRQKHQLIPQLAVIYIGNDKASLSYIRQKQQAASDIGVKLKVSRFPQKTLFQPLERHLKQLANDPNVHGIIIQRPTPDHLSADRLCSHIPSAKDVDGFGKKSKFTSPVALAVFKILKEIYYRHLAKQVVPKTDFPVSLISWAKKLNMVVIGRGSTGGKPITDTLAFHKLTHVNLHSQTKNAPAYLQKADLIISAVGKPNMVTAAQIKQGCILIGVGV